MRHEVTGFRVTGGINVEITRDVLVEIILFLEGPILFLKQNHFWILIYILLWVSFDMYQKISHFNGVGPFYFITSLNG